MPGEGAEEKTGLRSAFMYIVAVIIAIVLMIFIISQTIRRFTGTTP